MSISESKARIRIQELIKKINFYNKQYHTHDKSIITDSEYDILYAELKELEKQIWDLEGQVQTLKEKNE